MVGPGLDGLSSWQEIWEALTVPSQIHGFSKSTNRQYDNLPNMFDFRTLILSFHDLSIVLVTAIIFTLMRVVAEKYFLKVGHQYGMPKADQYRFAESSWKYLFYIISFGFGMYFTIEGRWFHDTNNCWTNWPDNIKPEYLDLFYLTELGFYTHSIFAFFTMEQKRSDSWLLLTHHLVTFSLIYWSYCVHFERIGVLVLITHDFNDIFLEFGKTFVYKKNEFMKTACFATLIASWAVTRLWLFPFYIIYSAIFESFRHVPFELVGWVEMGLISFLCTLLMMHIYWFYLMMRIVYKKLVYNKEFADDREEESEEEDQKKK